MPISPNTTFTTAVLTSTQMNAFGFGVVALATSSTSSSAVSVETLAVTSNSFTAIANRYYEITYYEPTILYSAGTVQYVDLNIRLTSISGTMQQAGSVKISNADRNSGSVSIVKTLSAGSTVVVGTFTPTGGGTATCFRAATALAYLVVKDIGPA